MKKTNRTLFIVNSPLQCLCMIEAIHYFKIENYEVMFRPDSVEASNVKTEKLLQSENIPYQRIPIGHILKGVLRLAFRRYSRYSRIFIGDYFEGGVAAYALSFFWGCSGAEVIYLDDGTGTLSIFDDYKLKRYENWRVASIMKFYSLLGILKHMPKEQFFTYFDIESDKYQIHRNNFTFLISQMKDIAPAGVYVIGTISSAFHFGNVSYNDYLDLLSEWINQHYPLEKVYYCPHRRDKFTDDVLSKCKQIGWNLFDTEVSVEYDFVHKELSPKCIVGFNSSALYSLNMMYPDSEVCTSVMRFSEKTEYDRAMALASDMRQAGILTINLDNE